MSVWLVYSVWDVIWTAINALVISSDLCSVWQFHIFYITMTGSFLLSSCSVFLPIIKLTSTWSCLYNNSRPWATPEQPLVEDTHTCTALSFVTLRTSWVWDAIAHKQCGGPGVAIGKSIEWLCMEDRHSVKLSRLLAFDCAGIERLSVLQRIYSCVSLGEPRSVLFAMLTFSPTSCVCSQRSQARRGPTHPVTVMFYTPWGRATIRNHGHSTRQKTRPTL